MGTGQAKQQHWIYVIGGAELREKARHWEQRKTGQGKAYALISGSQPGSESATLADVKSDDVLYVLAGEVRDGRLGSVAFDPRELAAHLRKSGLPEGHRELKIFASRSGDEDGGPSYAEQLYQAMLPEYPDIVVFGYRGQVDPDGFDGHKTAGLGADESLDSMTREQMDREGSPGARQPRTVSPGRKAGVTSAQGTQVVPIPYQWPTIQVEVMCGNGPEALNAPTSHQLPSLIETTPPEALRTAPLRPVKVHFNLMNGVAWPYGRGESASASPGSAVTMESPTTCTNSFKGIQFKTMQLVSCPLAPAYGSGSGLFSSVRDCT